MARAATASGHRVSAGRAGDQSGRHFQHVRGFRLGACAVGRVAFSIVVAFAVGLVFHLARPQEILLPQILNSTAGASGHDHNDDHHHPDSSPRMWQALSTAGDDFLDMGRYLIIGALLAAAMQTLVSQSTLLAIGQGPIISVFVMMAVAFILSVCSTVDAFIALAFSSAFTTGSLFGFLVFGPMVDVKSSLLFLGVFRRRAVLYLILLPLSLVAVIGVFWNVQGGRMRLLRLLRLPRCRSRSRRCFCSEWVSFCSRASQPAR